MSSSNHDSPHNFNKLSWFTAGVLTGTTLHTSTALILIFAWLIVSNNPLPGFLGGYRPQEILSGIFNWVSSKIKRKNKEVKIISESSDKIIHEKIENINNGSVSVPFQQRNLEHYNDEDVTLFMTLPRNRLPPISRERYQIGLGEKSRVEEQ